MMIHDIIFYTMLCIHHGWFMYIYIYTSYYSINRVFVYKQITDIGKKKWHDFFFLYLDSSGTRVNDIWTRSTLRNELHLTRARAVSFTQDLLRPTMDRRRDAGTRLVYALLLAFAFCGERIAANFGKCPMFGLRRVYGFERDFPMRGSDFH